jgi:hypothetical protein
MNQLQALAMNEGYRWKKKLFREQGRAQLEKLTVSLSGFLFKTAGDPVLLAEGIRKG